MLNSAFNTSDGRQHSLPIDFSLRKIVSSVNQRISSINGLVFIILVIFLPSFSVTLSTVSSVMPDKLISPWDPDSNPPIPPFSKGGKLISFFSNGGELISPFEKGGLRGIFSSCLYAIGLIPSAFSPLTASISHTPQFGQRPYLQSGIVRPDSARLYSFSRNSFSMPVCRCSP